MNESSSLDCLSVFNRSAVQRVVYHERIGEITFQLKLTDVGGNVVARVDYTRINESPPVIFVANLIVDEKLRRNGLGTQLIQNLLKTFNGKNATFILLSKPENYNLYERIGFEKKLLNELKSFFGDHFYSIAPILFGFFFDNDKPITDEQFNSGLYSIMIRPGN